MATRQCTVEIENKCSEYTFCNPQVFTFSGIYEKPLPPTLGPSESCSALFVKTPHGARGAVGVLTYDLQNESKKCDGKMAVMFSIPYDYFWYRNWYGVGVYDINTKCDKSLFHEMYYNTEKGFVRAEAKDSLTYRGEDVNIAVTMSDSCTPVIKVQVSSGSSKHH